MKRAGGFTLLEILVAVGLFSVVSLIATGSLLILSAGQRKTFSIQTNQDNVRFALESVAREIRTGFQYTQDNTINQTPEVVGGNCPAVTGAPDPTDCFQFVNTRNELVIIKRSTNPAECGVGAGPVSCIAKSVTPIPPSPAVSVNPFEAITAPEVIIVRLRFIITGESNLVGDNYQPRVTIILGAETQGTARTKSRLDIQTTVSQLEQEQQT